MKALFFIPLLIFFLVLPKVLSGQNAKSGNNPEHLVVVWSSGDPYVAEKVAFMYTHAAKTAGWFDKVTLIVWGPSAKLAAENTMIQEKLTSMMKDGVILEACIACARSYGVDENLTRLGIDVKGMGKILSGYLKNDARVITF